MVWDGIERRRRARVVFLCKVKVISSSQVFFAHTKDISEDGVKIVLTEALEPRSDVELHIKIETKKVIKCKGAVIWVDKAAESIEKGSTLFNAGIQFTQIDNSDRRYIAMIVAEKLALEQE